MTNTTRVTKIALVLVLCISFFFSICPPGLATPRRVEECGVEAYVSKAAPACGEPTYKLARAAACGVEKYNEQTSRDCPGYIKPNAGWFRTRRRSDGTVGCPDGYQYRNQNRDGGQVDPGCGVNNNRRNCRRYTEYYCSRPETIRTCRLPQFGVESYNQCRNLVNGIESYQTCARPEFGVALYKECNIRKTKAELTTYIQSLEPNIDVMGVALIQNTGNLLKLDGNETALACYIKRWDSDPLYTDAIKELKTIQFPALFGIAYDPNNYDCSNPPKLNVSTQSCSDGTPRCKFQTAYNAALSFFETNKAEVAALLDDIVARSDSTFKAQLENLNVKMDSYYSP